MDRKTLLITGGRGFIGSYLRQHYSNDYTVYAPERSRLDFTNADSVGHFFDTHKVDIVIHTALVGRNNINGVDHLQAQQNMDMFNNLWRNKHKFGQLINMGTGNEFDTTSNIDCAHEDMLFSKLPLASYAYAKNLIARVCRNTENFTNLRLFGVYHHSENAVRFFRRLKNTNATFNIFQDQQFDFFNLEDLPTVIDRVIDGIEFNDLNVAYKDKFYLSEMARRFADIHNIPQSLISIDANGRNHFTADVTKLETLNLNFKGLDHGFRLYK